MHKILKTAAVLWLILFSQASAAETGTLNANDINVRCDSSANSTLICKAYKGQGVEVVSEKYGWYKIKLPKTAPCFVKKMLVAPIDEKTAKGLKENINVRLEPSEGSRILGKIDKNEVINILEDKGEWYKIEPPANSYGWVHKKFVEQAPQTPAVTLTQQQQTLIIEGTILPYGKVLRRRATHKFIVKGKDVFLLKGNPDNLNSFIYRNVKITAKPVTPSKKTKYPLIEIIKMEAVN